MKKKLISIRETYLGLPKTSKMALFVTLVNGFQLLTIVTNSSVLDFLVVLDTPLNYIDILCF